VSCGFKRSFSLGSLRSTSAREPTTPVNSPAFASERKNVPRRGPFRLPKRSLHTDVFEGKPVYTQFRILKPQGGVSISPVKPTYISHPDGKYHQLKKGGGLNFSCAKGTKGATGLGNTYDWKNKIDVSLSVHELGQLLTYSGTAIKFVHDPGAGTPSKGQILKTMTLQKGAQPGSHFLNVSKKEGESVTSVSVSVLEHELAVLKELVRTQIPLALGWGHAASTPILQQSQAAAAPAPRAKAAAEPTVVAEEEVVSQ